MIEGLNIRWEAGSNGIEVAMLGAVEVGRVNPAARAWRINMDKHGCPIWRSARSAECARQHLIEAFTRWVLEAGLRPVSAKREAQA